MKSLQLLFFCILINPTLQAQNSTDNLKNGVAIAGYDPVSYFDGKPLIGKSEITNTYLGAVYYFKSTDNLDKFKASPNKYAPQYGGWCAYAMGEDGSKVKIDPETFKITNGKLYLFYNFGFTNTLNYWNKDEERLITKANEYWAKISDK